MATRQWLGATSWIAAAVAMAIAVHGSPAAQQGPQTHWEPYKNRQSKPSTDQRLSDPALVGAIDLHAHHDPDSYPRQWDAFEVARLARERGLRGVLLKNHWTETAGLAYMARKYATPGFEVFGSVTLDTPVGGVNPQAVRYMVDVAGNWGRIVWMPTHDSDHEIGYLKESRPAVSVSRNGALLPAVLEVIALVKQHDLTLATGHVTPEETLMILREARRQGVQRLIVTHPLLGPQFTLLSMAQIKEAAGLGAYIEVTAGALSRDGEQKARALEAIRAVGPGRVFVSSDSGLIGTPNHPDALAMAARALRAEGFAETDLDRMFKDNPAYLVRLPPLTRTARSTGPPRHQAP